MRGVFPISRIDGVWVTLGELGRDDKLDLHIGEWIEVVDDAYLLHGQPAPLLRVTEVDVAARRVQLSAEPRVGIGRLPERHPHLRRWDHGGVGIAGAPGIIDGALQITKGTWIDLEDGIQVWFAAGGSYRPGDYWMTAARTITGDVEWPRDEAGTPLLAPPVGPQFYYAPLAWVRSAREIQDLRELFRPIVSG